MELIVKDVVTFIDDEDFEKIKHLNFCLSQGYVLCYHNSLKNGGEYLHRIVMNVVGSPMTVDHINCKRLDNRKSNLRVCTLAENLRNRDRVRINKTSQYIGVSKAHGKWHAQIKVNGKTFHAKSCMFELEAALSYDALAKVHHGEFANLNFPTDELYSNACIEMTEKRIRFFNNLAKLKRI